MFRRIGRSRTVRRFTPRGMVARLGLVLLLSAALGALLTIFFFGSAQAADPSADLAVSATSAPDPVVAGEVVTYTVDVSNDVPSSDPAANPTVTPTFDINIVSGSVEYCEVTLTETCTNYPTGFTTYSGS